MEIVVTGIGLASALGKDLQTTWNRLLRKESGLVCRQLFPQQPAYPIGLIDQSPLPLAKVTQQVVTEALWDAGLEPPIQNCGIVLGSSRGFQAEWEAAARSWFKTDTVPENWLESLPHMAAVSVARYLQAEGPVLAPTAACATGLWAVSWGVELIRSGQCDRVLAGAVEAPITPLALTGFAQMGALAKTGSYPFDQRREGLALAEGGAVLLLERSDLAKARGKTAYGQVLGFGLTADGYHVSAPDPHQISTRTAVQDCLQRSNWLPESVGYVHAHGTSTPLNDRNEAHLIEQLFPNGVPVSSTKGATGHTLGASGALGIAFCLMALKHQILPPSVGLQTPDFDLDFVLSARSLALERALCLSFGFGGQNAAIALACV